MKQFFYVPAIVCFILLLILWELSVQIFHINPHVLPAPFAIITAYFGHPDILWPHIRQTILETIIGLLLAIILGVTVAIFLQLSSFVRKSLYPLLIVSQTIPIVALAPLLLIWFGFTLLPKILIVMLFCFFPITVAFFDGMQKN